MGFCGSYRVDKGTPRCEDATEGKQGIASIQGSRLPSDILFLPSSKRAAVPVSCPDCQCGRIHRSRTRGTVEFLLAFLRFRPYRCEECDFRFFRWSVQHKLKPARPARIANARNYQQLTTHGASHGGLAPQADMD